jgi:predicted Fe-Mo cluster-binding NifX family protein
MKIAVTANGQDLDAPTSPIFGRCPTYILVDTETMQYEAVANPAIGASGGAGIQAAQYITGLGVEAILSGNVGPNAYGVLSAAGVPVYLYDGGTVRQAVEAYNAGELQAQRGPSGPAHAGMGRGGGRGRGR